MEFVMLLSKWTRRVQKFVMQSASAKIFLRSIPVALLLRSGVYHGLSLQPRGGRKIAGRSRAYAVQKSILLVVKIAVMNYKSPPQGKTA